MNGQLGREVVIVEAVRTPVGRGHKEKGYYKDTHPADLLGKTYTELVSRTTCSAARPSRRSAWRPRSLRRGSTTSSSGPASSTWATSRSPTA
jgi:hypothetical protein